MAAQGPKSMGRRRSSTPCDSQHGGGADTKPVPGYLRPSAGSCHHVCKYGGTHTFEDHNRPQPRPPRKQQQPAAESHSHNRVLVKVRSVFRRPSKAAADKSSGVESVEWKDIVAYDTVPLPPHGSSSPKHDGTSAQFTGGSKKKDVMKGKRSHGKAKTHEQVEGQKPRAAALLVENMGTNYQEMLQGYQILPPSLLQSRASLLRDLEKEMMVHHDAADAGEGRATPTYSPDPEECAAAAESSRPIPAHRRVQSMSISSRSARHPFARQASRNSGAFKLRSRSTRAPAVLPPPDEEKPARLRSRRGGENPSVTTERGIHLRIRSLRKRGVGASAAGTAGFVVPAVALRHQKTLEKNKSQRLYNNLIEETATRLVKTRKSRVKALVGAFETVISKIAK